MKLKENCSCDRTQLVKKGFNGSYAVRGIIASILISAVIIFITISSEKPSYASELISESPKDYTFVNSVVLIVCGMICSIGVFAGTIQMNTIYRICLDCGDKITFIQAD